MQISGSLENIGEHYKTAALGTNPNEVAFCLFRTELKRNFLVCFKYQWEERLSQSKMDIRAVVTRCNVWTLSSPAIQIWKF